MPIFWEWNRKTFLGNFATGEQDLEKKYFWQWELRQFFPSYDSHWVFLNMSETSWHLLRLDVFPKFILSNAWFLTDCFVQGSSKHCCTKCVIFKSFISNCTFLQQISGELISFSMIRPSVFVIQFTKGRYLLHQV